MKRKGRDAILQLIELEREGEQIDGTLLKNILGIFIEVGMGQMTCYQQDFELQLLKTSAEYYKRKAAVWIEEDSCPDYMVCSQASKQVMKHCSCQRQGGQLDIRPLQLYAASSCHADLCEIIC